MRTGEVEKLRQTGFEAQDALIDKTIAAALAVHSALGPGHLESVYSNALTFELTAAGVPFIRESPVSISYRGQSVGNGRVDFLLDGVLVVEIKAVEAIVPIHTAQVISYLKILNLPVGLLINFNTSLLKNGLKRVTHPKHYGSTPMPLNFSTSPVQS